MNIIKTTIVCFHWPLIKTGQNFCDELFQYLQVRTGNFGYDYILIMDYSQGVVNEKS